MRIFSLAFWKKKRKWKKGKIPKYDIQYVDGVAIFPGWSDRPILFVVLSIFYPHTKIWEIKSIYSIVSSITNHHKYWQITPGGLYNIIHYCEIWNVIFVIGIDISIFTSVAWNSSWHTYVNLRGLKVLKNIYTLW